MLEDSISCSPGNDKKKSRSRRFHKKANKKSGLYNAKPTSNNTFPKELPNLEAIYEESTHSKILNATTQLEFFNPFENEKLLAAADRAEASTSSIKLKKLTSNGFVRLESLPFEEENKIFPMKPPECPLHCPSPHSPTLLGTETQFGITESELLRFCDEAETDVLTQPHSDARIKSIVDVILDDFCGSQIENKDDDGLKTPKQSKSVVDDILADFCGSPTDSEILEKTPPSSITNASKKTKSIVDEILEDFCGSPYSKSPSNPNSEDSTPVFRFKSQPIRTYSRSRTKNKCARNIGSELNVVIPEDDGNVSDSSSGLSVQEDFSQSVVPQLDTVDLNKSVKLCENLLNLSSYFSQVELPSTSNDKSPPAILNKSKDVRISQLIEEIIQMKAKSLAINRNRSEDEFRGFSDYDSDDSKESTLKELLENEDDDDVLQQINCDSLCYDKIEAKLSYDHIDKDFENTLRNASAVIEQAKRLILKQDENLEPKYSSVNMYQPNCDMPKDIQNKLSTNPYVRDEQLFDDVDIWNDSECLLNYKTQNHDTKCIEKTETNLNDDASCKIPINTNNYDRAIYKENDVDRNTRISNFDIDNRLEALPNLQRFQSSNDPCTSSSLRPSVARKTSVRISSNLNKKEVKLSDKETTTYVPTSSKERFEDNKLKELPAPEFIGFATASKKSTVVSDAARQRANEFLKKFEQEEHEEKIVEINDVISKDDVNRNKFCHAKTIQHFDNASSSTAFKNPITTSMEADKVANTSEKKEHEQREENILPEDSIEKKEEQCDIPAEEARPTSLTNSCLVGFSTASKKKISISDEAKQKADNLLKKFEQEEHEKRILGATDITPCNDIINKDDAAKTNVDFMGGFSTASKKHIPISVEAKRKADEMLKKFEEAEREEQKSKDMAIEKSTQRHADYVSEEVRRKAQELLLDIEFFEEAFEDELKKIEALPLTQFQNKNQTAANFKTSSSASSVEAPKRPIFEGFKTASKKSINVSEEARQHAEQLLKTVYSQDLPEDFLKCIETELNEAIENVAIPKCSSLMERDEQVDGAIEEIEALPLTQFQNKNQTAANFKTSSVEAPKRPIFEGFKTASKKSINVSEEARQHAEQLLQTVYSQDLPEDFLKCIETELNEAIENVAIPKCSSLMERDEQVDGAIEEIEALPLTQFQNKNQTAANFKTSSSASAVEAPKRPIFEGFKTASKKSINVSEEARQHAEQLLKTVYSQDLPEDFLKCIETELNEAVENKKCSLMERDEPVDGAIKSPVNRLQNALQVEPEHLHAKDNVEVEKRCSLNVSSEERLLDHRNFDPTSEWACAKHDYCQKTDANENAKTRKRKHSEGHIEDRDKSPLHVTPRRLSCGERTPLNRINNALLYKTSSLPLKESTPNSALISRKNLLSLSKRKKIKSVDQKVELSCRPKTPTKIQLSSNQPCNTNSTPDLKGFFDSVSTSTPRFIRNSQISKIEENPLTDVSIDPDFRQIQWEDSNNSIRINRTSCVTDANVTFSQVSPSPKQRIEVLKMYGEPPAISPILMVNNNCRPSGLRRGRRLMKP